MTILYMFSNNVNSETAAQGLVRVEWVFIAELLCPNVHVISASVFETIIKYLD